MDRGITFVVDVPAHGHEAALADTLASVRAIAGVTDQPAEVIVVGPVTAIAASGLEPPVDLIATRLVPSAARTSGARLHAAIGCAHGEFITVARGGERWGPTFLTDLLPPLRRESPCAFAWGRADGAAEPSDESGWWGSPFGEPRLDLLRSARGCAVLMRRTMIVAEGGIDGEFDHIAVVDLLVRMAIDRTYRRIASTVASSLPLGDRADAGREWALVRGPHARAYNRQRRGSSRALLAARQTRGFDPRTWTRQRRELFWQSQLAHNSLGIVGRELLAAVQRLDVTPFLSTHVQEAPPDLAHLVHPDDDRGRLAFHFDNRLLPGAVPAERVVLYGMIETNRFPAMVGRLINQHIAVCCTPSTHSRDVLRNAGVRVPIVILPHGADAATFPLMERPQRPVFTFGSVGQFSVRKGLDVLIRAFQAEFRPHEPVRLVLKGPTEGVIFEPITDPRVELRTRTVDLPQLREIYRSFDAFVLPSRGEGFGLTGLEAMSTGLPTIATNWSGPADYLDPRDSFPLAYRLVSARIASPITNRIFGDWAEPDEAHLRALMRWIFSNRAEAAAMGRAASQRVHRDWSWEIPARRLVDVLDQLARGSTPPG